MNAAQLRMDNIANNVANVNTQDFQPQRLQQTETAPPASAPAARDTYEPTAAAQAVGAGTEVYSAGTERPDLARDMTDMVTQRNSYEANAQTARVQNSVIGTTMDLLG
jgi:flagellar hook protein FlgE